MTTPHILTWPEITTLLAAIGLAVNASISYFLMKKSEGPSKPQALRIALRRHRRNLRQ